MDKCLEGIYLSVGGSFVFLLKTRNKWRNNGQILTVGKIVDLIKCHYINLE